MRRIERECNRTLSSAVTAARAALAAGSNVPRIDPGSTIRPGTPGGSPSRLIRPVAQERVTAFTIWVVVAFVNSQTALPVIQ